MPPRITEDDLRRAGVPIPKAKGKRAGKPQLLPSSFEFGEFDMTFVVGLHVVAGDNSRGMGKRIGRAGHERKIVSEQLATQLSGLAYFATNAQRGAKVKVTLTRLGGREMDYANVVAAMKYVQDTTAMFLGVDDGIRGPIRWEYDQEPSGPSGVRIRIELLNPAAAGGG